MSRKAAPRKAGAYFAAALALASVFNTGASATETFKAVGNFYDPSVTDQYGITLPGCRNGMRQKIKFFAEPPEYFAAIDRLYVDFKPSFSVGEDQGPEIHYNYAVFQMMPESFRNFTLYRACIINYYGDQALRRPINKTDYTVEEIRSDCSAVIRLREENRLSAKGLQRVIDLIGLEDSASYGAPNTPKAERRIRNINQCYYYNTTAENQSLLPTGRR